MAGQGRGPRRRSPRRSRTAVDELVKLYVSKSGSFKKPTARRSRSSLSEVDEFVAKKLASDEKLLYLGERTISRLGCFGCHTIPGFENAKPIGTALNDWGIKNPARLDFGHISEYLTDQSRPPTPTARATARTSSIRKRSCTRPRMGFLFQKLHRPRSYDYLKKSEKYKTWDDRLRMPQFAWANDPAAVEEVMTFVLGLTNERIAARYLPKTHYDARADRGGPGREGDSNRLQLHRLPRPGDAQVHDSRRDEGRRGVHRLQGQPPVLVHDRANDYLAELYPGLTYDPRRSWTPT